jgi:zinc transport system ATP-binding protein
MAPEATAPADRPARRLLARVDDIVVRLGAREVLGGVGLAVHEREIVTLIGPNGAGKSTVLRVLLGLLAPARGRVERRPGLRIGYMPQRLAIDDILPLPVARFLTLGGRRARADLAAVLEEVGAPEVLDVPIQAVSGGEFQRVLLARALLRDPELLVLDEPVQGVDIAGQHELFELIVAIRDRRGCGVLMVSHDLHLVMAATDTVVCINRHVCCTGRPEAVTRHPAYLALFGPLAAEGLAVYTHHHDHVHDAGGGVVPLHPHRHDHGD